MRKTQKILRHMETPLRHRGDTVVGTTMNLHVFPFISRARSASMSRSSGQALMELAVFSTIFLIVLSALVAYGLKYNYNQRAQMLAFRRAMAIASDTNYGSGSYMLIQDRHIPDPLDAFGVGSIAPFSASASIVRDPQLDAQAADAGSLPATVIDMEVTGANGQIEPLARLVVKESGFRNELVPTQDIIGLFGAITGQEINKDLLQKYRMIYGDVVDLGDAEEAPDGTVRIVDACIGEMIDYASCYAQAVKIVDTDACVRDCQISATGETDCNAVCGQRMNPPNQDNTGYDPAKGGAWYAANWRVENGKYVFPVLDEIFERVGANAVSMGMQPDAVARSTRSTRIRKIETSSRIVTDEVASWQDDNIRQFVTFNNLGTDGYQVHHDNPMDYADQVNVAEINSQSTGDVRQTMTTPK